MVDLRSIPARFRDAFAGRKQSALSQTGVKLVRTTTATFTPWSGDLYDSDITRAAIYSFAEIVSKADFCHVRGRGSSLRTNPDADIRLLFQQPNEIMTMQDVIKKAAIHYQLYNNAFLLIVRAPNGRPTMLYPIDYTSVQLLQDNAHRLYLRFRLHNAGDVIAPYSDIIHLRKHFNKDDFFGDDNRQAIADIMEVLTTSDQGMVNAVKNSAVINWILKFKQVLQPEDVKKRVQEFSDSYLKTTENGTGVVPSDPRYDAEQITHTSFVPNAAQSDKAKQRLYAFFGTNEAIVTGKYTEAEYNAYYEKECEPFLKQLGTQCTWKFFSAIERANDNRILPDQAAMYYSNSQTKLAFVSMVDRGAITPNQWSAMFNFPPVEGGDVPIRRLDTAAVNEQQSQPVANTSNKEKPKEGEPVNDHQNEEQTEEQTEGRAARRQEEARHDWVFEMRAAQQTEGEARSYIAEGRAIVFETPTVMWTDDAGNNYYEIIDRHALEGCDMSDVPMRYNHSNAFMIVGRHNERRPARSTVDFHINTEGMDIRADLSKTESGRQLHEAIDAGLIDKMSFAFSVSEESYDRETRTRRILKIKKLWDVSAVDTPAYDTTSIYARNRFEADAETDKKNAEAVEARKAAAIADLDILLTLEEEKEEKTK